jgi:hypothetical protein
LYSAAVSSPYINWVHCLINVVWHSLYQLLTVSKVLSGL